MSQYGSISYFTDETCADPKEILRSAIHVCKPDKIDFVQEQVECEEWVKFEQWLKTEDEEFLPRQSWKPLANALPPLKVADYYRSQHVLFVSFGQSSPIALRIYNDSLSLPESVRGDFNPWELSMMLGWHDLFSSSDDPHPRLIGRAFFSLSIGGQGVPGDWHEYRCLVWQLPAVVELARQLEPIIPSIKSCAIWQA